MSLELERAPDEEGREPLDRIEGDVKARPREQGELKCPYCHASFIMDEEPTVACATCSSVQHEACFLEAGACAACSSRTAVKPRVAEGGLSWTLILAIVLLAFLAGGAVATWSYFQSERRPTRYVPPFSK